MKTIKIDNCSTCIFTCPSCRSKDVAAIYYSLKDKYDPQKSPNYKCNQCNCEWR